MGRKKVKGKDKKKEGKEEKRLGKLTAKSNTETEEPRDREKGAHTSQAAEMQRLMG